MHHTTKINYLIADYVVRTIAARYEPSLAETFPIRSLSDINDAWDRVDNAYNNWLNRAEATVFYYAASMLSALNTNNRYWLFRSAFKCAANDSTQYSADVRELLNRAIDPERYW